MVDIRNIYEQNIDSIKLWITGLIDQYKYSRVAVGEANFVLLPKYFSKEVLQNSYVVYVDAIPVIPFKQMGLEMYSEMETRSFVGMTYLDSFFIKKEQSRNESLHFHELIHILQWKYLGIERFLYCYALGLAEHGYRNSPLEVMAYNHQGRYEAGEVYDVEKSVNHEMVYFDELSKGLFIR